MKKKLLALTTSMVLAGFYGNAQRIGTGNTKNTFNGNLSQRVNEQQNNLTSTKNIPAVYFDPIQVTTVAGNGTPGFADGNGAAAKFFSPDGLATDAAGNVYVADAGNNRIRKISLDGTVTTFAGNGVAGNIDGPALTASFNAPHNLCFDRSGNLYVTDILNHTLRKISPAGMVTTLVNADGWGTLITGGWMFPYPDMRSIAADAAGNIFIADQGNNVIRKVTPQGQVSIYAGNGTQGELNGLRTTATFLEPCDLAFDHKGNLIVAQVYGNPRKIAVNDTVYSIALPGFYGFKMALALDASDNMFVNVLENTQVGYVNKVTPNGSISLVAGSMIGHSDSVGAAAKFNFLKKITIDDNQNMYVTEEAGIEPNSFNHWIRKLSKPSFYLYANAGTHSMARNFTVSGNNLDGTAWLEAPSSFELAINEAGPYASGFAIGSNNGEIASQRFYVRLKETAAMGPHNDTVIFHANGAITQRMVIVGKVTDTIPPLVQCPAPQLFCFANQKTYMVPAVTASDASGIKNAVYNITGATTRNGIGYDASGKFNTGFSTISFTITDSAGNVSTCQTTVRVDAALSVVIPDVYPLLFWGQANTIYTGFGPSAVTLRAIAYGGTKLPDGNYHYDWSTGSHDRSITVNPVVPGNYHYEVIITDSLGCKSSSSITIRVIDTRCGTQLNKIIVCWPGRHGNTESCINENQVWLALLFGAKIGPCNTDNSSLRTAAIPEATDNEKGISVYPNPNKGAFVLQIKNLTKVNIHIYDTKGNLISSQVVNGNGKYQNVLTDLGQVTNGLYIIRAISSEGVYTSKILVQR